MKGILLLLSIALLLSAAPAAWSRGCDRCHMEQKWKQSLQWEKQWKERAQELQDEARQPIDQPAKQRAAPKKK